MTAADLLDSIAEERERRLAGRERPDSHAQVLWSRALSAVNAAKERRDLEAARDYALGIDYRHECLSSVLYAAHPLRVAALSLLACSEADVEIGIVGLLHNVLEVSSVTEAELHRRFGRTVGSQIASLTVDRARQWDAQYKQSYYDVLSAGPLAARVVKVMDKLDNLFLLHLNPDIEVKTRYAREIATYVLPMAQRDLPHVYPYLSALLDEEVRHGSIDVAGSRTRRR